MNPRLSLFLVAASTFAAAPPATFTRDVLPIFQTHCQACHRPGEIGPMPLLTYQQARPWAASIKEAVLSGKMPPWHSETPNEKFHNDPSLTGEERAKILDWASHGAPEGNPKEARPNPTFTVGWNIGSPDRVFQPVKPFEVPASGTVDYTYYILPTAFEHDIWITAAELRPDHRALTHHATVFVRPPQSKWLRNYPVSEYFVPDEQFSKPDAKHPAQTTNAGAGAMDEAIAAYVPGYVPVYPEGSGIFVPAGSDLVFQLHYTANGKGASDLPIVGFRFANSQPDKQRVSLAVVEDTFAIPPGAPSYPVHGKTTLGADCDLYATLAHMHLRGKSMLLKATYPDGASEVLLNVPHYDFNWQHTYVLASPKHLPAGTVLEVFATFDNSSNNPWNPDPGKEVHWGDQSWQEMMAGFFDVLIPSSMDTKLLRRPAAKPAATPAEAAGR